MIIKVWEICKNAYLFYFPYSIEVDEALYCIVWYGPLMVAVYNSFSFYMCVIMALKAIKLWVSSCDDHLIKHMPSSQFSSMF